MNRRQKIGFVSVASLVMAIAAFAGIKQLQNSYAATVHYVSTTGSDTNPGTQAAPWRTMKKSLSSLAAGDTLMVGGGTYVEDLSLTMNGSSGAPITVKNVAGQRPIIEGLLAVTLNYVTMDGINVHWRDGKSVDVHMLKLNGGTGWRWTNSEIWGAKSWANILITQSPNAWSLDHNRIHNNDGTSHTAVQDHNVYVNTTNSSNTGKIEHNLFYASPRGESIKLDGTGSGSGGGMNISVKYNTMVGASRGMLMGGQSHGNDIAYNIIIPSAGDGIGFYLYNCSGTGNKLHDNIFYGYKTAIQVAGSASAMSDTNNAKGTINPQLDSSYRPQNSAAANYGYYAGESTNPTPTPSPTPSPTPTTPPPPPPSTGGDTTAPTISMTAAPTTITLGQSTTLSATATDNVAVTKVEFYTSTGSLITTDTSAPYSTAWTPANTGLKTLYAKAYDAAGNSKTSATVNVTVNATTSPTPSPTPTPPTSTTVPGDANGDNRVNGLDYSVLAAHDGQNYAAADFNKDGTVGAADLAILLAHWTW